MQSLNKIPIAFFFYGNGAPQIHVELESILNSQNNLETENKVGRFTFPNFKTYKIIKLLEGNNICVNLHDLKFGNGFLDVTPKHE